MISSPSRALPDGGIDWIEMPSMVRRTDVLIAFAYFVIGFSPISALALAIWNVLPLGSGVLFIVLPLAILGVLLLVVHPGYVRVVVGGFATGLLAVFLYDCTRMPWIALGVWGDFIPNISMWLLGGTEPNWLVGYTFRYVGDGGGMGMAFSVAYSVLNPPIGSRKAAVGYAIGIWLCLMATVLLAPNGERMLFKPTPTIVG